MPPLNIKTYFEEATSVEAEGREIVPAVTLPPLPDHNQPALERLIEWGKERRDLAQLMANAEATNANGDEALESIIAKFPVKNKTRRVPVPQELVDKYAGGDAHALVFGVQDVESQEQWNHLENQVEWMRRYFPDVALYTLIDNRTGKKTALVMGIEAHAFNSLAKAERKRQQLNAAVRQACKELSVPEEWVDRKIDAQGSGNNGKSVGQSQQKASRKTQGRRPG